ncbi:uncharacterized protein LOC124421282 [Lucilia cuprina]|uniref:uncharacterized protein LOC124421282 n=1 Tax=Lucilia cuprina TaxID=7375 RepID=UPI001F06790F|nr:uncharacterized protein LOC124421282 [Lucilia cuprina]
MDSNQFQQLLEVFTKNQRDLLQQLSTNATFQQTSQRQQQNVPPLHAMIPPFENFDASKENFKLYRQRFENYLNMKGVLNDKTVCHQMLVNSLGSTHFKLLVSLVAPKKITEIEYDELVKKLEMHLCPEKNILVIQHRFLSTYQNDEQSLADYVAILRRDINECKFVSTCACQADISNIFLRAQFIRGIKDNTIREQLLQSEEPDFAKIMQKALSLEASKIDSRELNSKTPINTNDVNKVYSRSSRSNRRSRGRFRSSSRTPMRSKINFTQLGIENLCIRCGKDNHKTKQCRTNPNKLKCRSCGKTGHVQQVCLKTLINASNNNSISTNDNHDETVYKIYGINKIVDINQQFVVVAVEINGRRQTFEVDSGVKYTLIKKVNTSFLT